MKYILTVYVLIAAFYSYSQPAKNNAIPQKKGKPHSDSASKVNWLKHNTVAIRSIDSADENFSDLMPLKKIIGDAQVVMLGEQTHFDGATYLGKARLIKFLHKEMGFDVLAFESGFYDVGRAWQNIQNGKTVKEGFDESVFFSNVGQYRPLIEYIQRHSKSQHPLEITGFDSQITGTVGRDFLLSDLRKFFSANGVSTTHLDDTAYFARQLLGTIMKNGYKSPDKMFFDTASKFIKIIDSVSRTSSDWSTKYYKQLLKSTRKQAELNQFNAISRNFSGADRQRSNILSNNMRDAQMAENLLWYIQQHPDKKVIVWAATFHTVTDDIPKKDAEISKYAPNFWRDSSELVNLKVMGQYIKENLGSKVYSIAFTAYEGAFGVIQQGIGRGFSTPLKADQRPEIEFEEYLNATGLEFVFVDLRKPPKGGEWLRKNITSRPMGNTSLKGEWHKAVDGFFYIRKMFPTSRN